MVDRSQSFASYFLVALLMLVIGWAVTRAGGPSAPVMPGVVAPAPLAPPAPAAPPVSNPVVDPHAVTEPPPQPAPDAPATNEEWN
jgi:hypothetical protein